jgi:phenylalanyl-tRNA synthetase alpha chain
MDEELLIESLSPIERELLPYISSSYNNIEEISKKANQDKTTSLRAVAFLKNKNLVEEKILVKKKVNVGILGIHYLKRGLPERKLIDKVAEKKVVPIGEIKNLCNLNDNEAKAAFGALKKKGLIEVKEGKILPSIKITELSKKMLEELFLEKLPLEIEKIKDEEKEAFDNLKSRKDIIQIEEEKTIEVKLTVLGEKISKGDISSNLIEKLTPKIIKQGSWKGKKFRRYDIVSSVPKINGGKRHFVNQAKDYAKNVWLEMGFKEMTGNYIDTSFWVFDALFTAQDHPVREMQDTFYIKKMKGSLPFEGKKESAIVEQIKKAHEGGIDKSIGWKYEWNKEEAKRLLLRTHTTCLSIRKLKEIADKKEFPAKYFALGKCFRNETVDWSHGFEFNQTEGIVVDENASFRQLLGYLRQFFKKMGYEKLRIRPGFFAYTEPSLEIDVYHPIHKKWVELGGAGMFRPEVTIPLFGKHIPVLAWGPGFDRIIMEYFNITDLRDMYSNNITKLRDMKYWRK